MLKTKKYPRSSKYK